MSLEEAEDAWAQIKIESANCEITLAELSDPDDEYTDEERFRDEEYIREQNEL